MAIIESESLILKSYSLAEADKIIVFLTKENGLVRGVAKGAKRLKSRFGGSLEPFSIVNLNFYQKEERELVTISSIEIKKSYFSHAAEPEFLQNFAYLAELLIEFAPPHEPNEKLYRMAKICLETAAAQPENLLPITVYFELWILRLAGYLPDWKNCENCQKPLGETEKSYLQINFRLLCRDCQKFNSGTILTPPVRIIFFHAQKSAPLKFIEQTFNQNVELAEISQILKKFISKILGKEVISEKVKIVRKS